LKYACPKCKAGLGFEKTFNRKIAVSCASCNIGSIMEFAKNSDEVYLDFLTMYDNGEISEKRNPQNSLRAQGMIRDEREIREMIGKNTPDEITKSALFSKRDYVSHYTVIKSPEPRMGAETDEAVMEEGLAKHLKDGGISRLYEFQEEAIREIMYGGNVVIEAPTASGKTEAFVIPVIQKIKSENVSGGVFAIFVYPTKALARDQFPKISELAEKVGIRVAVYDGDTKQDGRRKVLDSPPQIIITNFDVLHYHMWHRTKFASLLGTVRFVVVDEVHVYSGIFGSNVHYVIKRLKRMCRGIQFVCASATVENAEKFCGELFGEKMGLIRGAGKRGETDFVMIFPSLRAQRALMVDLAKRLTARKHKTMVFSNSHLNSELLAIQARRQGINIRVHRAGLMANYRRSVERAFKEGRLDAISCTPTLELGIDVGGVDGVISSTIPVNRLLQRIGRAARKGQKGYAFLALGNDPISQYYKNHPQDYLDDVERSYIDPKNPFVEEFQILAMACDRPISKHELREHSEAIQRHVREGNLMESENRYVPNLDKVGPALSEYSIRGIGKSIDIFLDSKKVGDRVLPIALEELHRGAIYFLGGTRYRVRELQYPNKNHARLEKIPRDYPYYTKALTEEWPTVETTYEKRNAYGTEVAFCKLHIRKRVYGYANVELGREVTQGEKVPLDEPLEYDFVTKGIVFHAPRPADTVAGAHDGGRVEASGYHATEHVIIEGSNMITGGASQDLGGISLGKSGLIFVYDGAIGGSGASRALYDRFEKAVERGLSIVRECPCENESGCPRCTFSYRCGNNNEFLHKHSSLEVFQRMMDGEKTVIVDPTEGDRPLV